MLSTDQVTKFNDNGFLVVENVLESAVLSAVRDEYSGLINRL